MGTRYSGGRRLFFCFCACAVGVLVGSLGAQADGVEPWVYAHAGLDHFYNLEYDEAIADFQKAIEGDPKNVHFYNYLANAYLFQELHRLGQLEGNLYDASNAFLKDRKREPDRQRIARFKEWMERGRKLCEQRLAKNSKDVEALYALGAGYGMEANYLFTVEKAYWDALRTGGKANDLHVKVLKLDPNYHDAKLIPGVYQYVVGSIPGGVKWLAFLFGYRGSKEKGVRLLNETMKEGKLVSIDAAFLLAVIYSREKRHDYSRQLLAALADFYPRNPMIRLEIGRSHQREGHVRKALEYYEVVARDAEAGKFGHRVPRDRLWYQIGTLHQQLRQHEQALDAYGRIINNNDGDGLMKAYSGLRRGEIFLAQNHLDQARAEYQRVAAMPYEEPRREAEAKLRTLGE
ncbi:MAG: DUF3808 domain-containing protein [Acidobacteria bacterium]|nr:DUF3808 domain-containing protein [Acidobacteriota bacterium]